MLSPSLPLWQHMILGVMPLAISRKNTSYCMRDSFQFKSNWNTGGGLGLYWPIFNVSGFEVPAQVVEPLGPAAVVYPATPLLPQAALRARPDPDTLALPPGTTYRAIALEDKRRPSPTQCTRRERGSFNSNVFVYRPYKIHDQEGVGQGRGRVRQMSVSDGNGRGVGRGTDHRGHRSRSTWQVHLYTCSISMLKGKSDKKTTYEIDHNILV